jgi:hypothetical protein
MTPPDRPDITNVPAFVEGWLARDLEGSDAELRASIEGLRHVMRGLIALSVTPADLPSTLRALQVGDILEHTDGPRKGRQVIIAMCLYDKYAVRSLATGRLSYVRTQVLRSKHYKLVESK